MGNNTERPTKNTSYFHCLPNPDTVCALNQPHPDDLNADAVDKPPT